MILKFFNKTKILIIKLAILQKSRFIHIDKYINAILLSIK